MKLCILQVGKAYFHLVDYLKADYAFSCAHQISPYNLEGMDIYSTVLYVSDSFLSLMLLFEIQLLAQSLPLKNWSIFYEISGTIVFRL